MAVNAKSNREAFFAAGSEVMIDILLGLPVGEHLFFCATEIADGVTVPARAVVTVESHFGFLARVDASQEKVFATVLGAGLLSIDANCMVTVRSTTPGRHPVTRVWDKLSHTSLRPLTADEAHSRFVPEDAKGREASVLAFRSAFRL
ncbi:hypothetical protein ACWCWD_29625 [Streptomyces sp. NPDC001493]